MNLKNKNGAAIAVTVLALIFWFPGPIVIKVLSNGHDFLNLLYGFLIVIPLALVFGGAIGSFFTPVALSIAQRSRKTEWIYVFASVLNVIPVIFSTIDLSSLHESSQGTILGPPGIWADLGQGIGVTILALASAASVIYLIISLVQLLVYRTVYGFEFKLSRKPTPLSLIIFSIISAASLAGAGLRLYGIFTRPADSRYGFSLAAGLVAVFLILTAVILWFFINKKPLAIQLAVILPISALAVAAFAIADYSYEQFYLVASAVLPVIAVFLGYFVSAVSSRKKEN